MSVTPDYSAIGLAVVETQGVLELVAGKLRTSGPLAAEESFTLFAAVRAAIARLDAVHDALHASGGAT